MARKLGLRDDAESIGAAEPLIDDLLGILQAEQPDFTSYFRALAESLVGDDASVRALLPDTSRFEPWSTAWRELLDEQGAHPTETATAMNRVNPLYIPRNHLVEEALTAATAGDLQPFAAMLAVFEQPFTERPGLEAWASPPIDEDPMFRTFCGT